MHAAYLKRTNARGASACRDGRICVCACGRVSRRRRALTRAESNNSREYVRPRYESLDTTERSFPPRVTHARACERTRAYNRVKFDNKAGKLWTECLPRVDNTEGSYVPFIFPETYFDEYQFANIGSVGYLSLLPRRACFFRLLEKFFNCSRNATKFLRHALQFQWNPCKWNILINIPRRFSI